MKGFRLPNDEDVTGAVELHRGARQDDAEYRIAIGSPAHLSAVTAAIAVTGAPWGTGVGIVTAQTIATHCQSGILVVEDCTGIRAGIMVNIVWVIVTS